MKGGSTAAGNPSFLRWAWDWVKSIFVAVILFLIIRTFIVEAFRIPTGSMENTLLVGDFLLVNKAVYGAQIPGTDFHLPAFDEPHRGDVVVFVPPHEPDKNYVKRLIGEPGDTLAMREGVLFINGEAQVEPYVQHRDPPGFDVALPADWQRRYLVSDVDPQKYRPTRDNWGPIVVPEGKYFMLGDNRDDSEDSRYWGFVDGSAIKGQPLFIYYSFDPSIAHPFPWLTQIRWGRIGSGIH
ncbi:MAG TPA: signal peptidase I [Longimicrobiales bacterium]